MWMRLIFSGWILLLTGCQSTIFAAPEVVYESGDNIGVNFVNVGFSGSSNEAGAMQLIADYCKGKFKVTGRSEREKTTNIDAQCTRG
jgi:hypothetical protein